MTTSSPLWVASAAASFLLIVVFPVISADVYVNNFAVHIEGGHGVAARVARETGMKLIGQIGSMEDYYLLEIPHRERRSASPSHDHHTVLNDHGQVLWFEQQIAKSRKKRDFHPREVAEQMTMVDPYWKKEWYLHGGGHGGYDMNVMAAWKKGFTGKNVVVTILDDGLERDHPDLVRNYDPFASYDVNNHDSDPMPRYDPTNENRHGTRCAGEVSAEANNTYCTIGIAPDSRIGGVRMLDGEVFDAVEAASLSFNRSHIDIYSASWGPDDDGKVVDGPGKMAKRAFIDGIHLGRGGKGSIFVWASGNGGSAQDSCNCDGYANSIYTLSISSTSENGRKPWYLEECSSTLATTYSSGSFSEKRIASTDLRKQCTDGHTGTSASAPLAAGIVAMVLEANKHLSWRDVQYITLMCSRPDPMVDGQWVTNGVGRKVSLRYGYGLMDASAMVDLALLWNNVPPKQECLVLSSITNAQFSGVEKYIATLESNGCHGLKTEVNHLEHVQARLTLSTHRRGDLVIFLTSPMGTRSKLLPYRPNDAMQGGFNDWPFLSVHFWGENPAGTWTLEVENGNTFRQAAAGGTVVSWSIVLHGTKDQPVHLKNETYKPTPTTPSRRPTHTKPVTLTTTQMATASPETCHEECEGGCSGKASADCVKCKHFRVESTKECVASCADGFYPSDEQRVCMACDASCATCSGPTLGQCLSCRPGLFYDQTLHVCFAECKTGFYKNNQVCSQCHSSCRDCVGLSTSCTACQHGRLLYGHSCRSESRFSNESVIRNVGILVLCISIGAAAIIVVVVGVLFARNNGFLCWSDGKNYGRVPDDDDEAVVHLTYSDDFDDDYGGK